jgi:hypothetical protein
VSNLADDRNARPQPTMLRPNDAALNAIAEAREAALLARTATEHLLEIAERADQPAHVVTVRLTATKLVDTTARQRGRSIGVYNPTSARIYLGIGGQSANAAGGSPSCPPNSLLVLPVTVDTIEVGVDAADVAAGDAVVLLLFFPSVQPAFLGRAV